eukprot:1781252-Rhodomonas_salina.2
MPGQELAVTAKKEKEVVVFIDGLFGGGVAGSARKALSARFPSARFVTLHCGAVSSVRDRAVECFYQLKGGQTDYCVANPNLEKGHGRYGLKYPGLHPEWDETQPVSKGSWISEKDRDRYRDRDRDREQRQRQRQRLGQRQGHSDTDMDKAMSRRACAGR